MCGISGYVSLNGQRASLSIVQKMNDAQAHRGPDGEGYYTHNGVCFGHRRLKIIDLSERGKQPMTNEDQTLWLTYNGEIYNYRELREDLRSKGHQFVSETDSEVIIHGFEEYGENFFSKLNGIFAFALLNQQTNIVHLVRDPFGVKPLYFAQTQNSVIFASEIKAILASGIINKKIDIQTVYHYLSMQAAPSPRTFVCGVKSVEPGHFLRIEKGNIHKEKYFHLAFTNDFSLGYDPEKYIEKTKELLFNALKRQQMSDVQVGAFLSGGVDSGGIVGIMSKLQGSPLKTFCLGTSHTHKKSALYDERADAKTLATMLKTDHTSHVLRESDIVSQLKNIVWSMDQPSGRSVISYFIFQLAKKDVKVIFSGTGGDETFFGYDVPQTLKTLNYFQNFYHFFAGPLHLLNRSVFRYTPLYPRTEVALQTLAERGPYAQYLAIDTIFSERHKQKLFTSNVSNYNTFAYFENFGKTEALTYEKCIEKTAQMCLIHEQLPQIDAMSMYHGLEARVPLLDLELVTFMHSVPSVIKRPHIKDQKFLLKKALEKTLPHEFLYKKKQGFAVPFEDYIKNQLKPIVDTYITKERVEKRGLFHWPEIKKLYSNYYNHTHNPWKGYLQIWLLVVLEIWCEQYIDNSGAPDFTLH